MPITIIAEAGVNHNGSEKLAFQLIDAASKAGADIIKFQTFKTKNIVTEFAQQADYQINNIGIKESQFSMLSRLELSEDTHYRLKDYCQALNIEFLSTAFDFQSLEFLVDKLKLHTLKIPSGELTNAPLLLRHAQSCCNIILSTGMATIGEIEQALAVIAYGFLNTTAKEPSLTDFQTAYLSLEGQQLLKNKVTLLHCTTEYPAPVEEINLNAMRTLAHAFDLPIGYSDHSEGIVIPIASAALGATIIEKHFTLDKSLPGPDHKASLNPSELESMVHAVRSTEQALGSNIKGPQKSEISNKNVIRKSLVANQNIRKGDKFTAENIGIKRPGDGLSPYNYWSIIGNTSEYDFSAGDLIRE